MAQGFVLTTSLTVGQVTFIIHATIWIISYCGTTLLVMILLANAPRTGIYTLHDAISRIITASSQTRETAMWLYRYLSRRNSTQIPPPLKIVLVIFLYLSFLAFISVSGVGFVGFRACIVPGHSYWTRPASVNNSEDALSLIHRSLPVAVSPGDIELNRCESTEVFTIGRNNVTIRKCTSWHNSTYDDRTAFSPLNWSDSEVLMPRFHPMLSNDVLKNYQGGPGTQRITTTTILDGIIVYPHDTGMLAVVGVPNLSPNTRVEIPQTLAINFEAACTDVGITDLVQDEFTLSRVVKRKPGGYHGPDVFRPTLTKYMEHIRYHARLLSNLSCAKYPELDSVADCTNYSIPSSGDRNWFTPAARVRSWTLSELSEDSASPTSANLTRYFSNCSAEIENKLGIVHQLPDNQQDPRTWKHSCFLLGVGGNTERSPKDNVLVTAAFARMVCSMATQVTLVNANVTVDVNGSVSLQTSQLASTLRHIIADSNLAKEVTSAPGTYYPPVGLANPIERMTLTYNPESPTTSHYILNTFYDINYGAPWYSTPISPEFIGFGSAGEIISRLAASLMQASNSTGGLDTYGGLRFLDQGFKPFNLNFLEPKLVTEWLGQAAASYILETLSYNGWAALDAPMIKVVSTGGQVGTCYNPLYAIAFLPLVLAMLVVTIWSVWLASTSSFSRTQWLRTQYSGMTSFLNASMGTRDNHEDPPVLTWELTNSSLRLRVAEEDEPIEGSSNAKEPVLQTRKTWDLDKSREKIDDARRTLTAA